MTVGGVGVMARHQSRKGTRDKQDGALLGRGGLAVTRIFTVAGKREDKGGSGLSLTLRGAIGTEDCVMGDRHIAVWPFPTTIQPDPSSATGWYRTLSQPECCI